MSFERHSSCEASLGLTTLEESAAKAMHPLLVRLRSLNPSMVEVTQALEHLAKSTVVFSVDQRREIGQVVQSTMADHTETKRQSTTSKTQSNLCLEHYLPARLWGCLESEDRIDNKFRQLAQFMCTVLGLRHPDAKTKRLAVVIVHLASKVEPNPAQAYDDMCLLNDIMDQKRGSLGGRQLLSIYPTSPKEFMDAFPAAYDPSDPPIASRLDGPAILERCRKDVTPIRCSNDKLRKTTVDRSPAAPVVQSPVESVNGALLSMLEKYMFSKCSGPPSFDPPVAQVLGGGSSSVAMVASPISRSSSSSGLSTEAISPGGRSMHGGIEAACLNPVHDKLRALQEKLGCLADDEQGAPPSIKAETEEPLPRLTRKRGRDPTDEENDDEDVDDGNGMTKHTHHAITRTQPKV